MKKHMTTVLMTLLSAPLAMAFQTQHINFDGQLLNDTTGMPLSSPVPAVTFQIVAVNSTAQTCILYQETHSNVALDSNGAFSVKIGPGGGGTRNTVIDGAVPWATIFSNDGLVRANDPDYCVNGYTPTTTTKDRKLRVIVGATPLSPDYTLSSVPMATMAETLQGKTPADFISSTATATASINSHLRFNNERAVQFSNGTTDYVALKAPATLTGSYVLSLPLTQGTSGQYLMTDGAGSLSWGSPTFSMNPNAAQTLTQGAATTGAGNNMTLLAGSSASTSSNANGGQLVLSAGQSTGTGTSGIEFRTAAMGTSGNSMNVPATRMVLTPTGHLGIGTTSPTHPLHVVGGMRLQAQASPPSANVAGAMYFSQTANAPYYSDGTTWHRIERVDGVTMKADGSTPMTGTLSLMAGTTVAESLKLPVGNLRTTPASGAIENDGEQLYFTNVSNQRMRINTEITALKTSDTSIVSSLAPMTDSTLSFSAASGAKYMVEFMLHVRSQSHGNIQLRLLSSTQTAATGLTVYNPTAGGGTWLPPDGAALAPLVGGSVSQFVIIKGIISTATNSTVSVQWSATQSTTDALYLGAGSHMTVKRIAN